MLRKFSNRDPIIIIIGVLHLALLHYANGAGTRDSPVYTCCPMKSTFKDSVCIQPSSEFEDLFHKAEWLVPPAFLGGAKQFYLGLGVRNTSQPCKTAGFQRILVKNPTSGGDGPEGIGENETGDVLPPPPPSAKPIFYSNGTMEHKGILYEPTDYCLDSVIEEGDGDPGDLDIVLFDKGCSDRVLLDLQIKSSIHSLESWIKQLFAAVAGLSFLFTTANVIIYLSLRSFLNVSGWVEFAYFLALGSFSALSIPALLYEPDNSNNGGDLFCYILSASLQFFEIATYSSFFMIAFDVYWMIRKSDAFGSYGEDVEESKLRLVVYYLVLLGIPIGVTTYGVVLSQESIPVEYAIHNKIPSYGRKSCLSPAWLLTEYLDFGMESATFIMILLSVNHIFCRLSRSADVDDAPRVSLLSNMFFFSLSYWIMDLLKFARSMLASGHHYSGDDDVKPSQTFWIVLEGFTYAQGIIVFIVFVFNRKTLRALKKKSGSDGTLREIFRHACCSSREVAPMYDDSTPMSPLMKTSSMRRSTVHHNTLY